MYLAVQFILRAKSDTCFSFVVCCLPVSIKFTSDHIGICLVRTLLQDLHGIICDRIKLGHLWSRSQPESTSSCWQRSPSILPLSLEASEQWDSHSLFGTVAALSRPGPSCCWAERMRRAEQSPPAGLLCLTGALQLCTTACWLHRSICSVIVSIWPTMTYKDRHKPGFELWGVWCADASRSRSRPCSHGQAAFAFFPGEKETLLELVCKAFSHIKALNHSVFKCLKRLYRFCLWMLLNFSF